jgi:hypothetical protein
VSCNSIFDLFCFVYLLLFFLVSVSFSFVAFLAIMALRPRLIVSMDNISEGSSSRGVAFEGKVLS